MNEVQPIRDKEMVEKIKRYLRDKSERNYMLFVTGINTGLRISDILTLKVSDVKDQYHIAIREGKTQKQKWVRITPHLRREFNEYVKGRESDEYLFQSRQRNKDGEHQPIGRSMAYQILNEAARHYNLKNIGTHTMRKTFGYHFYQQQKDVAMLQHLFNHADPMITKRYIGINQDNMDKAMTKFVI